MLSTFEILTLTAKQKEGGVWLSEKWGFGEHKRWWKNGCVVEHSFWDKGSLNGEYWWYDSNNILREHSFYKNGKLHGECKSFDSNGKIINASYWQNGVKVSDL